MFGQNKSYFNVPKLGFSDLGREYTEEELAVFEREISREERLKFVENVEAHPERLLSWDMDISFEEYARRVRAGEYD